MDELLLEINELAEKGILGVHPVVFIAEIIEFASQQLADSAFLLFQH